MSTGIIIMMSTTPMNTRHKKSLSIHIFTCMPRQNILIPICQTCIIGIPMMKNADFIEQREKI